MQWLEPAWNIVLLNMRDSASVAEMVVQNVNQKMAISKAIPTKDKDAVIMGKRKEKRKEEKKEEWKEERKGELKTLSKKLRQKSL